MATWINFKELRDRLNFSEVLASCNVSVKVKGDQAHGFCPLPTHPKHEGKKRSPSFSVNLKRGIWQCFSCRASGNVIDLVCRLQGMDPSQPGDVRKAALLLDERFPNVGDPASRGPQHRVAKPASRHAPPEAPAGDAKVIVNAPLDFELKHLDLDHPYLPGRGFSAETIKQFGLGFCSKGLMKDRIVIPLHDPASQLIGYAGRLVDDSEIGEENPKYRFPGTRERQGVVSEFHKSAFLYNGHRLTSPLKHLIIVEGFPSVWWCSQHRYENTVALMGSDCSRDQGTLIVSMTDPDAVITILTDGDSAGIQCAHSIFAEVAPLRLVRWAKLDKGRQPTDLAADDLADLLWNSR